MTIQVVAIALASVSLNGRKNIDVDIKEGSTLLSLLETIGISVSQPYVYSVNGSIALSENLSKIPLSDNDLVEIIPIVGGG